MSEVKLRAYLATALTGLTDAERDEVFSLSDQIEQICQQFEITLYKPKDYTDPIKNADKQPRDVYLTDKEQVATSDLILALCTQPSYGMGTENEIAANAGVPVIYFVRRGFRLSKMLIGTVGETEVVEYSDPSELAMSLSGSLSAIKPKLIERRKRYVQRDGTILPRRLKELRERSRVTVPELARQARITPAQLEAFENSDETISLMTVGQIRNLSEALSAPASYLLGETPPADDSIALRSLENLKEFARKKDLKFRVFERLRQEYLESRRRIGFTVALRDRAVLTEEDWEKRYEEFLQRATQGVFDLLG